MERLQEMYDSVEATIQTEIEKRLSSWDKILLTQTETHVKNFFNHINEKEQKGHVVITYLKSSYVTGTHHFKIALYKNEPFTNLYPVHIYMDMTMLFQNIEKDFSVINNELNDNFIRIKKGEYAEIKRCYLEQLYMKSCEVFNRILKDEKIETQERIVLFGEELGELIVMSGGLP